MVMSADGVKKHLEDIERYAVFYHQTGNEKFFESVQSSKAVILKSHEDLKEVYKDREDDIEFYWSMFHQIESIRINPQTSDEEKWEKIGELVSSILEPNEFG